MPYSASRLLLCNLDACYLLKNPVNIIRPIRSPELHFSKFSNCVSSRLYIKPNERYLIFVSFCSNVAHTVDGHASIIRVSGILLPALFNEHLHANFSQSIYRFSFAHCSDLKVPCSFVLTSVHVNKPHFSFYCFTALLLVI